jgi:hypothetical protein
MSEENIYIMCVSSPTFHATDFAKIGRYECSQEQLSGQFNAGVHSPYKSTLMRELQITVLKNGT